MATFTDNFALVKPTYGELADVAVINGNMDTIDGIMHSNRTMLAPAFSQTEDYAVGDVVVYEGNLYRFIVPHTAGNWDGTEVEQTTLGEEVSTKGGADVTKTASGNPIEISDGASAPLVRCVTEIQGSQDLHGYDKPWVGGAGKNKLIDSGYVQGVLGWNETTAESIVANSHFITSPYMPINNNTAYTLSAIHGNIVRIYVTDENHNTLYFRGNNPLEGNNEIIPATSGAVYCRVSIGIDDESVIPSDYGTKVYGQLELGSTATTFAPYSNICPITAYTEGEIEVAHYYENLTLESGSFDNHGTEVSNPRRCRIDHWIEAIDGTYTVTVEATNSSETAQIALSFFDSSYERIFDSSWQSSGYSVAKPSGAKYVRAVYRIFTDRDVSPSDFKNVKIYTDLTTHTTTFPSAIYRGSEDVVNGEVTSETGIDNASDLTWQVRYTGSVNKTLSANLTSQYRTEDHWIIAEDMQYIQNVGGAAVLSDPDSMTVGIYGYGAVQTTSVIYIVAPISYTPSGNIVYNLATPTTSSVTPTNAPVKSLSPYTHIESSTGEMEIEYITQEFQPIVDLIESSGGESEENHEYSTTAKKVGTWIDGRDIYEIVYTGTFSISSTGTTIGETLPNGCTVLSAQAVNKTGHGDGGCVQCTPLVVMENNTNSTFTVYSSWSWNVDAKAIIIQYIEASSNTRSLNLTKSAVNEIPDEIKNAEYEEKPDVNEADDDAPTEVDER